VVDTLIQQPVTQSVLWSRVYVELSKEWKIGQHVMICAPTGVGKSVCAEEIASLRSGVVVVGTKRKDDSMDAYLDQGYKRIYKWPPERWGREPFRYVLWPKIKEIDDVLNARPMYAHFLRQVFKIENATVILDECQFMTEVLGLGKLIGILLHQGRSGLLTIVSLSQRPVWIPTAVRSASSFAFLARTTDRSDLAALVEFGGADRALMREQLRALNSDEHELLFVRSRKPDMGEITVVQRGTRLRSRIERTA
jgi:hypothetical protein